MNLRVVGCNFRTAAVEVREKLAFPPDLQARAATELAARFACEAAILSTCNRVELFLARPHGPTALSTELATEFLAEVHRLPPEQLQPHLYSHLDGDAARHLFRVAASLDSLIVGEGQIAGQVKQAFELRAEVGCDRTAAERPVPARPADGQAGPHGDRHRPRARLGVQRGGRLREARCSTTSGTRRCW